MKAFNKFLTIPATLAISVMIAFTACAGNDRPAQLTDLPNAAQAFV